MDCESGLQKSDVTVPAGERLFFTTSCWDDMEGIASLASERTRVEAELEAFEKQPDDKDLAPDSRVSRCSATSSSSAVRWTPRSGR